jgi:hypothetical protein
MFGLCLLKRSCPTTPPSARYAASPSVVRSEACLARQNYPCHRRRLRFGFELRPPVAKRLERKPLNLTILSLIQITMTPRLMVRAPKGLAVTLATPPSVRHLFLLTFCKKASENRSRSAGAKQACEQWTLTPGVGIPCSLKKNSLLGLQKFPVPLRREFRWKSLNSLADWTAPESPKFPVNFPVSREFEVETGSIWSASTTTQSDAFWSLPNSPQFAGISRVQMREVRSLTTAQVATASILAPSR